MSLLSRTQSRSISTGEVEHAAKRRLRPKFQVQRTPFRFASGVLRSALHLARRKIGTDPQVPLTWCDDVVLW